MNAYDFDQTIYRGDSTRDFLLHCAIRHPRALLSLMGAVGAAISFLLGKKCKTDFKQRMFQMFLYVSDMDSELEIFWAQHMKCIKPFYMDQKQPDDLIVSASPDFLIRPALESIGITQIIASQVDARTGQYHGSNCDGQNKVHMLKERMPNAVIDAFYSDSLSDTPMAERAKKAYLVKGDRILPWPDPA
ncbi:HAD-IB family phosphatase [Eubacteriales bacterium OttesenSCG-928-N13]|nr:HAD-IB family phosphatase [Eubacteriales bacterium OttesenSCG-928-N13]